MKENIRLLVSFLCIKKIFLKKKINPDFALHMHQSMNYIHQWVHLDLQI
jgi:hypothetical protein